MSLLKQLARNMRLQKAKLEAKEAPEGFVPSNVQNRKKRRAELAQQRRMWGKKCG